MSPGWIERNNNNNTTNTNNNKTSSSSSKQQTEAVNHPDAFWNVVIEHRCTINNSIIDCSHHKCNHFVNCDFVQTGKSSEMSGSHRLTEWQVVLMANLNVFSFLFPFFFILSTHACSRARRWRQVIFCYSIWASLNRCYVLYFWYFRCRCWRTAMKIQSPIAFAMWMHSFWRYCIRSHCGRCAESISIDTIAFRLRFITMPSSARTR